MPADDRLWPENCNRAEDGREPTIEPNNQKAIGIAELWSLRYLRRSTLSCWRRIRISARSFVLGLKNETMIWRISRRNSIIEWQGYRVSASRLAESNFRYTQGDRSNKAAAARFPARALDHELKGIRPCGSRATGLFKSEASAVPTSWRWSTLPCRPPAGARCGSACSPRAWSTPT